jgi:hypothetical protein
VTERLSEWTETKAQCVARTVAPVRIVLLERIEESTREDLVILRIDELVPRQLSGTLLEERNRLPLFGALGGLPELLAVSPILDVPRTAPEVDRTESREMLPGWAVRGVLCGLHRGDHSGLSGFWEWRIQ